LRDHRHRSALRILNVDGPPFFFFSSRLDCFGSLLLSAVVTIALLFMFGLLRF
jgi:hypothetical protein